MQPPPCETCSPAASAEGLSGSLLNPIPTMQAAQCFLLDLTPHSSPEEPSSITQSRGQLNLDPGPQWPHSLKQQRETEPRVVPIPPWYPEILRVPALGWTDGLWKPRNGAFSNTDTGKLKHHRVFSVGVPGPGAPVLGGRNGHRQTSNTAKLADRKGARSEHK